MDISDNPAFANLIKGAKAGLEKDAKARGFVKQSGVKGSGFVNEGTNQYENFSIDEDGEDRSLSIDAYNKLLERTRSNNQNTITVSKTDLEEVFKSTLNEFLTTFTVKIQEATIRKTLKVLLSEKNRNH